MATTEQAGEKRSTKPRARKRFKSGRSAPDTPQLQDEIVKLTKRYPHCVFERTPQEDGSIVVALSDTRLDPARAIAVGQGKDTAAAFKDLKTNLPLTKGGGDK